MESAVHTGDIHFGVQKLQDPTENMPGDHLLAQNKLHNDSTGEGEVQCSGG